MNDLAAAREMVLSVICPFTEKMPVLADGGYERAGHGVLTPVKKPAGKKELDINARTRNPLIRHCGAWENAASPFSPSAGKPCSTSP